MKKVRLNLKRGSKTWSFFLYDSAESAYYLKNEPILDDEIEEYRKIVSLGPGETMEMEWVGSEWVYEDDNKISSMSPTTVIHDKFDKVRICKSIPIRGTGKNDKLIEAYVGWMSGKDMKWSGESIPEGVVITPIKGKMRSRFDFSELFESQSIDEEHDQSGGTAGVDEIIVLN